MRSAILDAIERVVTTYVQAFAAALLLAGVVNLTTLQAAALAGTPAALAVLKVVITHLVDAAPRPSSRLLDLAERTLATAAEVFLGALAVGPGINLGEVRSAELAAVAAGLAVLKGGVAQFVPGTVSPASLAPGRPRTLVSVRVTGGDPKGAAAVIEQIAHEIGRHLEPLSPAQAAASFIRMLPERRIGGKRLGRHVNHDPRSRGYAVTAVPLGTLASVRHHRHVPVYDQGDLGSCVAHALAGALSTAPYRHRFASEHTCDEFYTEITAADDIPGQWPPDDTGSDGLSAAKWARSRGWVTAYRHCFDLPAVLTALQTGPVLLGVTWLSGFDEPGPDGSMTYAGQVRGGHEIVADEIDVENRRVWITNSWGAAWGVHGRAWWSWEDLARVLSDYGDATVLVP